MWHQVGSHWSLVSGRDRKQKSINLQLSRFEQVLFKYVNVYKLKSIIKNKDENAVRVGLATVTIQDQGRLELADAVVYKYIFVSLIVTKKMCDAHSI